MPGFYSEEYHDLVAAQRVLSNAMTEEGAKLSERSQCARALVDIVRLKRDMRGIPDPKPVDVQAKIKRSRTIRDPGDSPTDPTAPVPGK
jgi:hypothetical protein